MRKVILFIATSLDGFIARKDGTIDWLFTDDDYGYKEFYGSIDTTLTGGVTYRGTRTFGEFPYPGKTSFVFSRKPPVNDRNPVNFISSDVAEFVRRLKLKTGKDIWLVGGGQINTILLNAKLIDKMVISVHPVILGEGIALFGERPRESFFELTDHKAYTSGLMQLTYTTKSG